jgi:hypothetical protein
VLSNNCAHQVYVKLGKNSQLRKGRGELGLDIRAALLGYYVK